MVRPWAVVALLLLGPGAAWADDIADALRFAQPIMGDEISDGLEEFIDGEPDEALSMLLWRQEGTTDADSAPLATAGALRASYLQLRPAIEEASEETGLPTALIDAVIRTESGYRVDAVSRTGAQGLMQLMPQTAAALGVSDPFNARQNIRGGARYLRQMLDRFGSLRLAIAAYNAGPGAVERYNGVPPYKETTAYVRTVLARYEHARVAGVQ